MRPPRAAVVSAQPSLDGQRDIALCVHFETGATGLEPATSGVADQFESREIEDG
jgi:hypothetical protein